MEPRAPRERPPRREGTASPARIVVTLAAILAGVAVVGWGVFALAGALVAPPPPVAAPAPQASVPSTKTTTSTALVKTDSAIPPSESTATIAKPPTPPAPAPSTQKATPTPPAPAPPKPQATQYVVVIDPGHQAKGNNSPEPIGPGASQTKPAVAGGATGVATHKPESLVNLQISLKLRDALQAQGVKVIMVRTSQNVNVPNSKRANIANNAHADLFLRVHCDSSTSSSITGFLTLVPARNKWTGPIVASSGRAGRDIESAAVSATGAHNRGVTARGDLSGFNWCKVPTALVECGMMSNPAEDRALSNAAYQQKLAAGITAGAMRFLRGQ